MRNAIFQLRLFSIVKFIHCAKVTGDTAYPFNIDGDAHWTFITIDYPCIMTAHAIINRKVYTGIPDIRVLHMPEHSLNSFEVIYWRSRKLNVGNMSCSTYEKNLQSLLFQKCLFHNQREHGMSWYNTPSLNLQTRNESTCYFPDFSCRVRLRLNRLCFYPCVIR